MQHASLTRPQLHSWRALHVQARATKHAMSQQQLPRRDSKFENGLQLFSEWMLQYGSPYVPRSAVDAAQLQGWISSVRRAAKAGQLTAQQQQQLTDLGFVWKPNTVDAKWHANFHRLRCWTSLEGGSLQQLLQYASSLAELKEAAAADALDWVDLDNVSVSNGRHQHSTSDHVQSMMQDQTTTTQEPRQHQQGQRPQTASQSLEQQQQEMQQQQLLSPDLHEIAVWLQRQVVLYGKLKLTPVKVQLLRKLGVKLKRQAGLAKPNLHPILQGQNPDSFKRRPIVVTPATKKGKRVVADILRLHKQQHEEQGEQQQQACDQQSQQHQQEVMQQQQQSEPQEHLDSASAAAAHTSCPPPRSVFASMDSTGSAGVDGGQASDSTAGSSNSSSSSSSRNTTSSSSPDCQGSDKAFMFNLADLQRWRKKYGTCYVPAEVHDAQGLADWVAHIRQQHPAAADAAALDATGTVSSANGGLSSSSSSSGRHEAAGSQGQQPAAAKAEAGSAPQGSQVTPQQPQQQPLQPQPQSQQQPGQQCQLLPWQLQELEAVGFVWRPKQALQDWCCMYHRLRHFKLLHHHIKVAGVTDPAAASAHHAPAATSTTGEASQQLCWEGLAVWLQRQDVDYAAGRLSSMQVKQLKSLGWRPTAAVGT